MQHVTLLSSTLKPLQHCFNAHGGEVRFLALLSPTCPPCLAGARAVRTAITGNADEPAIATVIVWLPMLAGDDEASAQRSASLVDHPTVRQFYDPAQLAGRSIARSIGAEGRIAWDMYLFYPPDSEWIDEPPAPLDWVHQLSGGWADGNRFYPGADLVRQLSHIQHALRAGR